MRPVEKKQPGQIVTYQDAQGHLIDHTIQKNYAPYRSAKLPLLGNLGHYCSYCEGVCEAIALEVEHLEAKSKGGSETAWENFLLSCKECNTIKSNRGLDGSCHWPHQNNTLLDFVYQEDGRVKLNPELSGLSKIRAQKLYDLVQLGRAENEASPMDFRWQKRYETWKNATKARASYEAGKWSTDDVLEMAKLSGHWSIWFTVFEGNDAILSRLISDFTGTCQSCFDAGNHYKPIPRNPSNAEDPV
jgi:5-methylcytosine-specific restriction endonuclease McrA